MTVRDGMEWYRACDYAKAAEEFFQVVDEDNTNPKAWNALGICLNKLGQYQNADTCFEKALLLDPTNKTFTKNRIMNGSKIPKPNPILSALSRPWWQYVIAAFFLLFIVLIIVSALSGIRSG
ncbi:MAG: tetratricopeptide repeat protein [Methanospirillaceae archaeon]|nr:tetratricopeptide repeat protein [Methanospirillaceae archaeon]